MPFLSGSVSAVQFRADWPEQLNGREVELLSKFGAEPPVFGADGDAVGWTAGGHRRDTRFGERNILGDFLAFDFRRTTDGIPPAVIRDYTAEALAAITAENDGRPPSPRQRRNAREEARDRAEGEAKDGRWRSMKVFPVVWDRREGLVWLATGSSGVISRFAPLFQQTFGVDLTPVTPATLAGPELRGPATSFIPGVTPMGYAWVPDLDRPDHLGNEFALWLMYRAECDSSGEIGGQVVMSARTLALDCPRGQTGSETVRFEGPTRLPEVRQALRAGKLPRQLGLTLVSQGEQYELTLHADRWSITAGRLPAMGDDAPTDATQRHLVRLEGVRAMFAAVRQLFSCFCGFRRNPAEWETEVRELRKWLGI